MSLVYDPITLDRPQQMFTREKSLLKGTGGVLVHPSLRGSTAASTGRIFGKGEDFYCSEKFGSNKEGGFNL